MKRVLATAVGAISCIVPGAAGLATFLDPLRRRTAAADFVPVAPLDAVPADGVPRTFQVIADRTDAWNRFLNEPIGVVFLVRTQEKPGQVVAFNAACPHLGCQVSYQNQRHGFYCPCHQSVFRIDGAVIQPSPAERGLDTLDVKIAETMATQAQSDSAAKHKQILVKFQSFRAGGAKKIPK